MFKYSRSQTKICTGLHYRQQDVLKRVLEVKPKKQKVSRGSDGSNSISSTQAIPSSNSDSNQEKQKDVLPAKPNDTGNETKVDNPIKSLVAAYESSDDEDWFCMDIDEWFLDHSV